MNANGQNTIRTSTTPLDDLVRTFWSPVDLSRLDIEAKQTGIYTYQESVVNLSERGYQRHLTPREHFAVYTYAGRDKSILAVQEEEYW